MRMKQRVNKTLTPNNKDNPLARVVIAALHKLSLYGTTREPARPGIREEEKEEAEEE